MLLVIKQYSFTKSIKLRLAGCAAYINKIITSKKILNGKSDGTDLFKNTGIDVPC
jgi:hypothetical protein